MLHGVNDEVLDATTPVSSKGTCRIFTKFIHENVRIREPMITYLDILMPIGFSNKGSWKTHLTLVL